MSKDSIARRSQAVEQFLRKELGLKPKQHLHPAGLRTFRKQFDAVEWRERLIEIGDYTESQIGIFAEEIAQGGIRRYIVDTYAGFALARAPECDPHHSFGSFDLLPTAAAELSHYYEIILESRPCWLYFDLEFSRKTNPELQPKVAMDAFRQVMVSFCRDKLDVVIDPAAWIELESSTKEKFSFHVVVKQIQRQGSIQPFAFANNAQAGLLVRELLSYARARQSESDFPARHLFVAAPDASSDPSNADFAKEACLVDESVYTRNRCFRLVYSCKFGKTAIMRVTSERRGLLPKHPAPCMLASMASFVPEETMFFRHPLIPADYGHMALAAARVYTGSGGTLRPRGGHLAADDSGSELLQYLVKTWDEMRKVNDPATAAARSTLPTRVDKVMPASEDGRVLWARLLHNRYCMCKGASHKSNAVYLVVDQDRCTFYQKCYDRAECFHHSSPLFRIPELYCDDAEDREFWSMLPALDQQLSKRPRLDEEGHRNTKPQLDADDESTTCPDSGELPATGVSVLHSAPSQDSVGGARSEAKLWSLATA